MQRDSRIIKPVPLEVLCVSSSNVILICPHLRFEWDRVCLVLNLVEMA